MVDNDNQKDQWYQYKYIYIYIDKYWLIDKDNQKTNLFLFSCGQLYQQISVLVAWNAVSRFEVQRLGQETWGSYPEISWLIIFPRRYVIFGILHPGSQYSAKCSTNCIYWHNPFCPTWTMEYTVGGYHCYCTTWVDNDCELVYFVAMPIWVPWLYHSFWLVCGTTKQKRMLISVDNAMNFHIN